MEKIKKEFKDKLIFGKYKILRFIGKGSFSQIYLGTNVVNKQLIAIKLENKSIENSSLEKEAYFLFNLKGHGIPSVISYGHSKNFRILILTLLGKSLREIWLENNKKLILKDICMIAIQTLERIQYIHSKDYIHRDIKPDNFLVGYNDNSQIYIIDFGNSRKYRSSRTKKHIKNIKINKTLGTPYFISINSLRGYEQSRRDDLESLGYMYIYLYKGTLPWCNIKCKKIKELFIKTREIKEKVTIEKLCENMPTEMCVYMKYVKNLTFEENPDYNFLRKLFLIILSKFELKNDNLFSWINPKKITYVSEKKNSSRVNPRLRLMNKIFKAYSKEEFKPKNDLYDTSKNSLEINGRKTTYNNSAYDINNRDLNFYINENKDKNNINKINTKKEIIKKI